MEFTNLGAVVSTAWFELHFSLVSVGVHVFDFLIENIFRVSILVLKPHGNVVNDCKSVDWDQTYCGHGTSNVDREEGLDYIHIVTTMAVYTFLNWLFWLANLQ